jgi:hypothetical protein
MWATNAYGTFWKICAFAPFHGRFFAILTVLYRVLRLVPWLGVLAQRPQQAAVPFPASLDELDAQCSLLAQAAGLR